MPPLKAFIDFLQQRTDARPLAVARLIIGGAAFLRGLVSYHLFDRVLTPGVIRARSFEWIPDITREALPWYIGVWLYVAAAFALGYRTRFNGSILVGLIVYHLTVDQNFFWSHIYFLGLLILLLIVADAGADLSWDWRSVGGGRKTVPRWGVMLLKLQIVFVYAVAALAKLNPRFLSGEVLDRAFVRPELLKTPELLVVLAFATVALEASMPIALWFQPLRRWAIASGIIFHALVPLLMGITGGLVVFSASIIGTYVLFLDQAEFAAAERFFFKLFARTGLPLLRLPAAPLK